MLQSKDIEYVNRSKNKNFLGAAWKRFTSDLKTHIGINQGMKYSSLQMKMWSKLGYQPLYQTK